MSNVRSYTDKELLERVKSLDTFTHIPDGYWLIGVRSNEDAYNKFDDKFYLFQGEKFIAVYQGTTNPGDKALKDYASYNPNGAAILQSDTIIYDSHKRGISKGRMVYRQNKPFPYYRDYDMDNFSEEIGEVHEGIIYAHIHDVKLDGQDIYKEYINGWSLACQVMNNGAEWDEFMLLTAGQDYITYCLLQEFNSDGELC